MTNDEKQQRLQAKYNALCAKLGDAILKKQHWEKVEKDCQVELEQLNKEFLELEASKAKATQSDADDTAPQPAD